MYSVNVNEYGTIVIVRENQDGSVTWIPSDENNTDYRQYLADTDGGLPLPKEAE